MKSLDFYELILLSVQFLVCGNTIPFIPFSFCLSAYIYVCGFSCFGFFFFLAWHGNIGIEGSDFMIDLYIRCFFFFRLILKAHSAVPPHSIAIWVL